VGKGFLSIRGGKLGTATPVRADLACIARQFLGQSMQCIESFHRFAEDDVHHGDQGRVVAVAELLHLLERVVVAHGRCNDVGYRPRPTDTMRSCSALPIVSNSAGVTSTVSINRRLATERVMPCLAAMNSTVVSVKEATLVASMLL